MHHVNSPYIIAEIGSNHDGDFNRAKRLIHLAKEAGADAVKFQSFHADLLCNPLGLKEGRWVKDPSYPLLKSLELPLDWLPKLRDAVKDIDFLSTPFDLASLDALISLDVPFIKIASGDITYRELLEKAALSGKPIFLSTGHATLDEIERALDWMSRADVILLHCVSAYPCPIDRSNVLVIKTLQEHFSLPVGLSDHSPGHLVPILATALGACVIEKHFTDDRNRTGPDHPFALNVDEFAKMVQSVREAKCALGSGEKVPCFVEESERVMARRAFYAARDLQAGIRLQRGDVKFVRHAFPGVCLDWDEVKERVLLKDVKRDHPILRDCVR